MLLSAQKPQVILFLLMNRRHLFSCTKYLCHRIYPFQTHKEIFDFFSFYEHIAWKKTTGNLRPLALDFCHPLCQHDENIFIFICHLSAALPANLFFHSRINLNYVPHPMFFLLSSASISIPRYKSLFLPMISASISAILL